MNFGLPSPRIMAPGVSVRRSQHVIDGGHGSDFDQWLGTTRSPCIAQTERPPHTDHTPCSLRSSDGHADRGDEASTDSDRDDADDRHARRRQQRQRDARRNRRPARAVASLVPAYSRTPRLVAAVSSSSSIVVVDRFASAALTTTAAAPNTWGHEGSYVPPSVHPMDEPSFMFAPASQARDMGYASPWQAPASPFGNAPPTSWGVPTQPTPMPYMAPAGTYQQMSSSPTADSSVGYGSGASGTSWQSTTPPYGATSQANMMGAQQQQQPAPVSPAAFGSTFVVGQPRPSLTLLRSSPSVNAQYRRLLAVDSARLIDEVKPPANFDGRKQWNGLLSPVLDQGQCGGCWAFASAGVLGDRFAIHTKGAFGLALSPEHLILCGFSKPLSVGNISNADAQTVQADIATLQADLLQAQQLNQTFQGQVACYGNTLPLVCEYLYRYGTRSLRCDPYTLGNIQPGQPLPSCRSLLPTIPPYERCKTEDRIDRIYRAIGRYFVSTDGGAGDGGVLTGQALQTQIDGIKAEIYKFGPIMAGYEVFRDFMQPGPSNPSWATGIYRYDGVSAKDGGHAITIVGWGTDPDSGETFWIIRNSWGVAWGEAGYFRMYAGQCGIEHNTMAVIPDLPGLVVPAQYVERFIVDEDSVTVRALVDVDASGLPASYVGGLTPAQRAAEARPIVTPDVLPEYGSFVAGRVDNPRAIPGAESPLPVGATRFVTPAPLSASLGDVPVHMGSGGVPVSASAYPAAVPMPPATAAAPYSFGATGPRSSWGTSPVQPLPSDPYQSTLSAWQSPAGSGWPTQPLQSNAVGSQQGPVGASMPMPWPQHYAAGGTTPTVDYFGASQQQQQETMVTTTTAVIDYGMGSHSGYGSADLQGGGCGCGPAHTLSPSPAYVAPSSTCGPCSGAAGPFPIIDALVMAERAAGHKGSNGNACARLPNQTCHGYPPASGEHPSTRPDDGHCERAQDGTHHGTDHAERDDQHTGQPSCVCATCRPARQRPRGRGRKSQALAAAAAYILVPVPEQCPEQHARPKRNSAHRRSATMADKERSSLSSTSFSSLSSSSPEQSHVPSDGRDDTSRGHSAPLLEPSSPSSIRIDDISGDVTSDSRRHKTTDSDSTTTSSTSTSSSEDERGDRHARERHQSRRHRRARKANGRRR